MPTTLLIAPPPPNFHIFLWPWLIIASMLLLALPMLHSSMYSITKVDIQL